MADVINGAEKQFYPFGKVKTFAELGTVFCIEAVRLAENTKFGARWFVDVIFQDGEDIMQQTLAFTKGESDRDDTLQLMVDCNDYPQHNCWIHTRSFTNAAGKPGTFNDLRQKKNTQESSCPCGMLVPAAEVPA